MDNNGYRLLLPEGTLDYFIISDVKESASEIVIYLEEKTPQVFTLTRTLHKKRDVSILTHLFHIY